MAFRRFHDLFAARRPFVRGQGHHGQGVYIVAQFFLQNAVHRLVTFDAGLTVEFVGHDHDLEVGFRSRRHIMHVAFIDNVQMGGDQRGLEFFCRLYVLFRHDLARITGH